jgi:hypothetical protein
VSLLRPLAEDPIAVFEQIHRDDGLEIDAETCCASWSGGTWDLNWALDGLRAMGKPKKRFRGNVPARGFLDEWFRREYAETPTISSTQ